MSVLKRFTAPPANHELAAVLGALLSSERSSAPKTLPDPPKTSAELRRKPVLWPRGVGTSAARVSTLSPHMVDASPGDAGSPVPATRSGTAPAPRPSLEPTGAVTPIGPSPVPSGVASTPVTGGPQAPIGEPPAHKEVAPPDKALFTDGPPLRPLGLGTGASVLLPGAAPSPGPVAPSYPAAFFIGAPPLRPLGLGTAASQLRTQQARTEPQPESSSKVPELYCPEAVRDDPALGEEVNNRLVQWADEVGIYPGQLDRVRSANVGRLAMLTYPDCDDPDRLLAAAKCNLAEWATDDHYLDDESLGADPAQLATRLVLAHAVVDPAHLPIRYIPELERAVREDPVRVAYRSSLDYLARYATPAQVRRLRHELSIMFVAYNQEGAWQTEGRTPPVWEYLVHRHENSFLPCMVLIDAMGGYELPQSEFADPSMRRVFTMAGIATVLVNDLYSMSKEQDASLDFNLPKLIAAEEGCSLEEAVKRTVEIHDELVHTVELEGAALSLGGGPVRRRWLAGIWAWLGGGREWHRTSPRYNGAAQRRQRDQPLTANGSS